MTTTTFRMSAGSFANAQQSPLVKGGKKKVKIPNPNNNKKKSSPEDEDSSGDTIPDDSATTIHNSSSSSAGLDGSSKTRMAQHSQQRPGGGGSSSVVSGSESGGGASVVSGTGSQTSLDDLGDLPEEEEEVFIPEPNDWHMVMEDENWEKLESMIKKYDVKYFKRLREKMELQRTREEFLIAQQQQAELESLEQQQQQPTNSLSAIAAGGSTGAGSSTNSPKSPNGGKRMSTVDQVRVNYNEANRRARESMLKSPTRSSTIDNNTTGLSQTIPSHRKSKIQSLFTMIGGGPEGRFYNNEIYPFPLLAQDNDGRTPLHLACLLGAPDKLVLELLVLERRAVRIADQDGQLVLHSAVQANRFNHVLEQLIKAHPNALKTKDKKSRSPIALAIELAKAEQVHLEPPNLDESARTWSSKCFTKDQTKFQCRQDKCWMCVDYLIRQLTKRKKSLMPSEHGLLIESVEAGAPPYVVGRVVTCTGRFIQMDDELGATALYWIIKRHYPLGIVQQVMKYCRERTTIMTDATNKALIAHYQEGTHVKYEGIPPFGKELIDWGKARNLRRDEKGELLNEDDESDYMAGVSKAAIEWWEILQHLLAYNAYGKNYQKNQDIEEHHLVQAGLSIAASPPSLISFLLTIFPHAKADTCPVYKALPIHLACSRWKHDILAKDDSDHVVLGKVMKQLLSGQGKETLGIPHRQRLPLHMALAAGQSWSVVSVLSKKDPIALGMRDPTTKLFPFQLAAVKLPPKNRALLLRMLYTPAEWRDVPSADKRTEMARVSELQDTRQVGTIFELLRAYPAALKGRVQYRNKDTTTTTTTASSSNNGRNGKYQKKTGKVSKDLIGAGRIAAHYLAWCYTQQQMGVGTDGAGGGTSGVWVIRPNNIKVLRDAVMDGYVPKGLEPWFNRLKQLIWHCYPGEKDSLPHNQDEYLLHAALYNPDTPPLIIELLLQLYPTSVTLPVPDTDNYPLHIAAASLSYTPQPFEIPNNMDALQLTLHAYPRAARLRLHGRFPLHIAIAHGKTKWKELRPLVEASPKTLLETDPHSGRRELALYPFQLMAASRMHARVERFRMCRHAEKQLQHFDLDELTSRQSGLLLRKIQQNYHTDILTSIYELLRHGPKAIEAPRSPPMRRMPSSRMGSVRSMSTSFSSISSSSLMSPVPRTQQQRGGKQSGIAFGLEAYLSVSPVDSSDSLSQLTGPGGSTAAAGSMTSPTTGRGPTLSSFLNAPTLDTPAASGKRAVFVQNAMSGSLASLGGSVSDVFDSQSRASYHDDSMSAMSSSVATASLMTSPLPASGASYNQGFMVSPGPLRQGGSSSRDSSPNTNHTPGVNGRPPLRGKRRNMRTTPIKLPDLG